MLRVDNTDLPMLEQMRQAMQKHRIQMNNRASAVERGVSTLNPETALYFQEKFQGLEDELAGLISRAVKDHEMWDWLDRVKGIGPGLAGSLLSTIDIERAQTVSALWRYAGQGVVDGESERRKKGQKLGYNAGLKKTCYLIGSSFLKANSPYRREYDEAKTYYQTNRLDWTPKHVDMAARRKMVKIFLSHLWTEWRTRRGLPVRDPYAMQVLNHDGHKPAENYLEPIHEAKPNTRGRPALLDHPLADPPAEARSSRSRRAVIEAV